MNAARATLHDEKSGRDLTDGAPEGGAIEVARSRSDLLAAMYRATPFHELTLQQASHDAAVCSERSMEGAYGQRAAESLNGRSLTQRPVGTQDTADCAIGSFPPLGRNFGMRGMVLADAVRAGVRKVQDEMGTVAGGVTLRRNPRHSRPRP
jgi:hypothetical protein